MHYSEYFSLQISKDYLRRGENIFIRNVRIIHRCKYNVFFKNVDFSNVTAVSIYIYIWILNDYYSLMELVSCVNYMNKIQLKIISVTHGEMNALQPMTKFIVINRVL